VTVSADLHGPSVVEGEIKGGGATVTLKSGTLAGTGTIAPRFINEAGTVEPGGDGTVGTLDFGGEYAQGEAGQLDLDLASDSSFDRIQPPASANALIGGRIAVHLLGSYAPAVGTAWDFVSGIGGALPEATVTPSEFRARSISGGAELKLESPLPSGGGGGGETPGGGTGGEAPGGGSGNETPGGSGTGNPSGGSGDSGDSGGPGGSSGAGGSGGQGGSGNGASTTPGSGKPGSPLAPGGSGQAGQCSAALVIRQAYVKGGHAIFVGAAPKSLRGKRVRILLGAKAVARATVRANGSFRAQAPAPKAKRRASARYVAALGSLRSCGTRLR
jgi:hypothetical protein